MNPRAWLMLAVGALAGGFLAVAALGGGARLQLCPLPAVETRDAGPVGVSGVTGSAAR